jgi:threonine dehydrogenase-like Zn-dependent dehydrogenase
MKAAIFYGEKDIRVEERPVPEPMPEEVLIRVRAAGICGSDLLGYNGIGPWQPPRGLGIEEGHELAGVIVQLGGSVAGMSVGQRVAVQPEHLIACGSCRECRAGLPHLCRRHGLLKDQPQSSHGFSEYDTCVAGNVWPIPDDMSFESAAIADCYGVALHAVHRVGSLAGQTVAVIGCGTIGLCIGQTARALGAGRVVLIGDQANAVETALSSGAADAAVLLPRDDPAATLERLTEGAGPTVIFEAVGRSGSTLEQALQWVARGGQICVAGTFTASPRFSPDLAYEKEVSLLWSNSYGLDGGMSEYQQTLELMSAGRVRADALITHRFPLDQIGEAFATANDKLATRAIKVVVNS